MSFVINADLKSMTRKISTTPNPALSYTEKYNNAMSLVDFHVIVSGVEECCIYVGQLEFLDFQFMSSSLEKLVENLAKR